MVQTATNFMLIGWQCLFWHDDQLNWSSIVPEVMLIDCLMPWTPVQKHKHRWSSLSTGNSSNASPDITAVAAADVCWHRSRHNIKRHSWISLSCLDTWIVAHMFLLSVSFGLLCSGKSLLWWQPFLHVIAEDSADVHKDKKGTCHTKSQNWCLRWARFHYCDGLVCEVEK